jgi:hypothetical protein
VGGYVGFNDRHFGFPGQSVSAAGGEPCWTDTRICPYRSHLCVPGAIGGICAYPGRGDRRPSSRYLVGIDKMPTTADTPQGHRRIRPSIAQRLADNAVSGIGACIGASRPRNRQSATELCMEE